MNSSETNCVVRDLKGRFLKGHNVPSEWIPKMNWAKKDPGRAREVMLKNAEAGKDKARAKRAKNPGYQAGESHFTAVHFQVRDPRRKVYRFKNLMEFLRRNPELFAPEDVEWKITKNGKPTCPAYHGIYSLKPYKRDGSPRPHVSGTWKGWTWYSSKERELGDLLEPKDSKIKVFCVDSTQTRVLQS